MKRIFLLAGFAGALTFTTAIARDAIPAAGVAVGNAMPPYTPPGQPAAAAVEALPTEDPDRSEGMRARFTSFFSKRTEPAQPIVSDSIPVGPGCCVDGGRRSSGECWQQFKKWLCYHPDHGKLLPCFTPVAYRPPLYNWFPCAEACAPGCGPWGGCGGPPITYYYPTTPQAPRIELRNTQPQPQVPNTAIVSQPQQQPQAQPAGPATTAKAVIPGLRFASAEIPSVADRIRPTKPAAVPPSTTPAVLPVAATAVITPLQNPTTWSAARTEDVQFQPVSAK